MTEPAPSPVPVPHDVCIHPGPALLDGIDDGPSLVAHRERYGDLAGREARPSSCAWSGRVGLRGRGGAAFPFATKLEAASRRRRPVVVVNLSEGEPASAKDSALRSPGPISCSTAPSPPPARWVPASCTWCSPASGRGSATR